MALLKILYIPDGRLREMAEHVENITSKEIQDFIDDMFETMYDAPGVGLAATQVGVAKQIAVIDVSRDKNQPLVLINPEIIDRKNLLRFDEGCLSVPGHYDNVERADWVKMRAFDRQGKSYELEAEGLLAECIQHEIDHLKGKLYIDYLSPFKQSRIRHKVDKIKRKERATK
jgi:peptide deformylase